MALKDNSSEGCTANMGWSEGSGIQNSEVRGRKLSSGVGHDS